MAHGTEKWRTGQKDRANRHSFVLLVLVVSGKRGDDVMRIEIHKASYERGKSDGEAGRRSTVPPGIDGFSYYSGYIEGKAVLERTKCPLFVPDDCRKERG